MNLSMIDEASWTDFTARFPAAHSFLLNASLKGEYRSLKKRKEACKGSLTAWEDKRLAELKTLFGNEYRKLRSP